MLVYATCSLSANQNEGVVERFLALHKGEVTLSPDVDMGGEEACPAVQGSIPGTLRFNPSLDEGGAIVGSGFFIAKFIKT